MRKNNWWDHLFNNHHYDFAYAYADPVIEDKKEEEEELFKQFFEWRIGRFFRKITRPFDRIINYAKKKVVNTFKDVTGITAAEADANRAQKQEEQRLKDETAKYSAFKEQSAKDLASSKDKYAAAKSEQESQFAKSSSALKAAQGKQQEAERVGSITAQYTQGKKSAAKRSANAATLKAQQQQALMSKRTGKQYSPRVASGAGVNIKGPGGVGGTGKAGSETKSAKRLRAKDKSKLNIG